MWSFYEVAGVSVCTQRRVIALTFMGMNKLPLNSELKLFLQLGPASKLCEGMLKGFSTGLPNMCHFGT